MQRLEAQLKEAREEAGGRDGNARRFILDREPLLESVEGFRRRF